MLNIQLPRAIMTLIEPGHHKTYNETCVTCKDSEQLVHPSSMASVLVYPSLDSLEDIEGTYDQRRLIRMRGCAGLFQYSLVALVLL